MRVALAVVVYFLLALRSGSAMAQEPDCSVQLVAANTAHHPSEIVVAPSTAVTLEAHCFGAGQPTYLWSTGQTTFAINVTSSSDAGALQTYSVDVSLGGSTRRFIGVVRTAAPQTPACALTREPSGDVRVFTTVRVTAFCPGATSYSWSGGYDLRGQGSSAVTVVNIVNQADTIPVDVIASNANGPGPVSGIPIRYTVAPPSCRIVANPAGRVAPSTAVTLSGECDGSPTSYSWAHGTTGQSVVVNPAITASYTLRAANGAGVGVPTVHTIPVSTTAPGLLDYTGHWWGGTTENGWGMTLNQHGDRLFGVLYFYDATGAPTWAVMPGGTWNADFTAFTGDLYTPTGTPYSNYDASQLVAGTPTGSITLTFASQTSLTASFRLGYSQWDARGQPIATFGQKTLGPLIFNSGTNPTGLAIPDMWWGGPAENGWGISVNQRGSEVFAAWFTYGLDRRPTWFILSGNSWSGNTLSASVLTATGSPWLGVPYRPDLFQSSTVGQATITFGSSLSGTFAWFTGVTSGTKPIMRQAF